MLNTESSLAHFVPLSTPAALIPFIVLIEIISRVIRPFTLSIRLAANIIAGHLLLRLLRERITSRGLILLIIALASLLALIVLELAVRVIQGYVFSLLSTLYLNEVNTLKFICLNNVYNIQNFLFGKEFSLSIKCIKFVLKSNIRLILSF